MGRNDIYLEIGAKRVFACALEWPGWARSGRDEEAAIEALFDYRARYAKVVKRAVQTFKAPARASSLKVVERLDGNATRDFGAPGIVPAFDADAPTPAQLSRLLAILRACWTAFDRTADGASTLRKGPRGGGRTLTKIQTHVLEAEQGYAATVGLRARSRDLTGAHDAFVEAVSERARGELPDTGPRGGARWPARYGIRRAAWHVLDHAWEIEDRSD